MGIGGCWSGGFFWRVPNGGVFWGGERRGRLGSRKGKGWGLNWVFAVWQEILGWIFGDVGKFGVRREGDFGGFLKLLFFCKMVR